MNLISSFLERAAALGAHDAIVAGDGKRIGFSDLARLSGSLAVAWKRAGVRSGDRVLVAVPLSIELYAAIAGLWRLGATVVFPEPAMGVEGVRRAVEIARPDATVLAGVYRVLPLLVPRLLGVRGLALDRSQVGDPVEDVENTHPALISFTSGSTGKAKAIVRTHGFMRAQQAALHHLIAPTRDDEVDLVAFPAFVILNLALGTTSALPNWKVSRHDQARREDIVGLIATAKVTRALIPPSICEILAPAGSSHLALGAVMTGGGPVYPDLLEKLSAIAPGAQVISVYGSTEAEPIAHQTLADITAAQWVKMRAGGGLLAGRPVPSIATRIEGGGILVAGDHVNKGYLNGIGDLENKVELDGRLWHRTGDAGVIDREGLLWLRGRLSARSGGLFPFEVEVACRSWPGVHRAALIPGGDHPVVAIEGEEIAPGSWERSANAIGVEILRTNIPLDRRHRSKVDYARLREIAVGR